MNTAWVGVIGALGGVAITGLIGLVTAFLNHRWAAESSYEDRQANVRLQRAELRRNAYARLLSATDNLIDAVNLAAKQAKATDETFSAELWYRENPETLRESQIADAEARIVAGDLVVLKLEQYVDLVSGVLEAAAADPDTPDWAALREAQKDVLVAMREEQAIDLGLTNQPGKQPTQARDRSALA